MTPKFKVLDVFFYKGQSITSKAIRLLSSVRYGMPYKDWQAKHQKVATDEQKAAFAKSHPHKH